MMNPPHPGQHVLEDCLEPLGLSITKAAEILGVTRLTLSNDLFAIVIRTNRVMDNRASHEAKAARANAVWLAVAVIPWDGGDG